MMPDGRHWCAPCIPVRSSSYNCLSRRAAVVRWITLPHRSLSVEEHHSMQAAICSLNARHLLRLYESAAQFPGHVTQPAACMCTSTQQAATVVNYQLFTAGTTCLGLSPAWSSNPLKPPNTPDGYHEQHWLSGCTPGCNCYMWHNTACCWDSFHAYVPLSTCCTAAKAHPPRLQTPTNNDHTTVNLDNRYTLSLSDEA
jgi:hypothetical protein